MTSEPPLIVTSRVSAVEQIEEIRGTCPKCGGPLQLKKRIEAWNADGTPSEEDTYMTAYCPACKLFWIPEEE
jgi:uncharacterized protein with PIN domain